MFVDITVVTTVIHEWRGQESRAQEELAFKLWIGNLKSGKHLVHYLTYSKMSIQPLNFPHKSVAVSLAVKVN